MEVVIGVLIGAVIGIAGIAIYRYSENVQGKRMKQTCVIYLLRVDPSGKVEIKNAPIQLWTWKY